MRVYYRQLTATIHRIWFLVLICLDCRQTASEWYKTNEKSALENMYFKMISLYMHEFIYMRAPSSQSHCNGISIDFICHSFCSCIENFAEKIPNHCKLDQFRLMIWKNENTESTWETDGNGGSLNLWNLVKFEIN